MRLLLHICCAPCTIYPLRVLREEGHEVRGLFYNPNIHPYVEYQRRLEAVEKYAEDEKLDVTWAEGYGVENFLRNVVFRENDRCGYCYEDRMAHAARAAAKGRFGGFTTTLLYSKFQDHDRVKRIGESLAEKFGVDFYYRDFREGWAEGIRISKERGIYRQQYCGCIYSERDRYYSPVKKTLTTS
jgi:epoxyqueuosine reductase